MLVPLTRKTFESLIPLVATGAQYAYCWGNWSDLLRRVLISVVGIFGIVLLKALFFRHGFDEILLISGLVIGLYWLWYPIFKASLQNLETRRYGYCGFWQGKVIDIYVTEELVGTEENVNNRGDLVVVENRERCLNLEVGDEMGFLTCLRVPLKRSHRAIDVGDIAELLVFSNRADLGRISKTSDIYIPDHNLWVSDYPYVQREAFVYVSRRINLQLDTPRETARHVEPERPAKRKRTPRTGISAELARSNRDSWDNDRTSYLSSSDSDQAPRRSTRRRSS